MQWIIIMVLERIRCKKSTRLTKTTRRSGYENPHHPIHANRNNMRKDSYRVNVGPRPQRDTGLGGPHC